MKLDSPCSLYLRRLAPSGRKSMASQLKQIKHILGWSGVTEEQPFHTLVYAEIECVKRQLISNGKSARTVNHAINGLKAIVKTGFLMGQTHEKSWLQVQAIKSLKISPSKRGSALTSESVLELLKDCSLDKRPIGIRDTAILAVFLATGIRRFEFSNLTTANYDKKRQSLQITQGKGDKARCQYLADWAIPYLHAWLRIRGEDNGYLFNPFHSRRPNPTGKLSTSSLYQIVTSRTEMTLEKSSAPHDLRRTFITQLLRQNVDLSTASKLAGHASLATTQIYDKRGDEVTREAALSLSFTE